MFNEFTDYQIFIEKLNQRLQHFILSNLKKSIRLSISLM
jgi:hypothetical protein